MARRTRQKYFVQKTRLVWKNQAGKHTHTTIFEHMLQKSNISKENKTYSKIRIVRKNKTTLKITTDRGLNISGRTLQSI